MEARTRTLLTAGVVLLVLGVPLVVLFAGGGDDGQGEQRQPALRVERSLSLPELVVYVDQAANKPERAGGSRTVLLRCLDADGKLVASQPEAWPFSDTDQGRLAAHTHVPLDGAGLRAVRRCRLEGTKPLLAAPVL